MTQFARLASSHQRKPSITAKSKTPKIQMEICGDNLRKWLNLPHDKSDEAVQILQIDICRGIVDGLAYLHEQQLIH